MEIWEMDMNSKSLIDLLSVRESCHCMGLRLRAKALAEEPGNWFPWQSIGLHVDHLASHSL